MPPTYVLTRPAATPQAAPVLDASQQAVVDHPGGPLLVLAGPGTGKTTTLVETVAARVEQRDVDPRRVLVLTFSRKAAEELRSRLGARLRGSGSLPVATTFHSFCYGVVREHQDPADFADPMTLLSAPEQDARIVELMGGAE
ncbi:UvrD-helicase domain-containing protein, partial [Solicola sp. PLA-1-18]|uniref:UvrD-helicase domain-containing protein n=1 Tax=Solicola sp. PLA-1-18 TaxID=3380532 RepID=UPI003B767B83